MGGVEIGKIEREREREKVKEIETKRRRVMTVGRLKRFDI